MESSDWEWCGHSFDYDHGLRLELWIPSKSPRLLGTKVGNFRIKQWEKPPTARQRAYFTKKARAELVEWANKPL